MKSIFKSLLLVTALGIVSSQAQNECSESVKRVQSAIAADKSSVLKIVASEAEANPDCVCEIVKSAIAASKASKEAVGLIVEAAGNAAPDRLDLIVQCATAAAPDAASFIQSSAASIRGSLSGNGSNPLDFPGDGSEPVGPSQGTDGGNSIIRSGRLLGGQVPSVDPPFVTNPNP